MDSAIPLQAFCLVVAPLAVPGIVTAAIPVFIFVWNDLLSVVSLILMEVVHVAPAVMTNFTGSSQLDELTGSIAATTVVITIPIVIFVVIFQRRIAAGPTSGAAKG